MIDGGCWCCATAIYANAVSFKENTFAMLLRLAHVTALPVRGIMHVFRVQALGITSSRGGAGGVDFLESREFEDELVWLSRAYLAA